MDVVKEVLDLGLGVLALSREKAEKLAAELSKKGKSQRKKSQAMINDFLKEGKEKQKELEKGLSRLIDDTLSRMDIATKGDIKRLENQIKKIKSRK